MSTSPTPTSTLSIKTTAQRRPLSLIIWGATGFTGRLVVEYLLERYGIGQEIEWAIAGRSQVKLERLRETLALSTPQAKDLKLFTADSHDLPSLIALSAQADVICSTVGPYALYGSALVEACVQTRTHYCDLTGEPQWIREMIDAHHSEAQAREVKIVHCCGYDSIPSDLGVLMMYEAMSSETLDEVKFFAGASKGGFSGGTIASMLNVLENASDPKVRRVLGHPYGLSPDPETHGADTSDQRGVRYEPSYRGRGGWTAPFIMASINTKVVRRSNALMGLKYGRTFRYSEVMATSRGLRGWLKAMLITTGLGVFMTLLGPRPTRALLKRFALPAPGEGPSKSARESGFFNVWLTAKRGERILYGHIKGDRDPGYGSTAIMLVESALCLATQGDQHPTRGGVLTPATAFGTLLIDRLREAGMIFEIIDSDD